MWRADVHEAAAIKTVRSGANVINGVPVTVVRRKARRINIRILEDGTVRLTVPFWWATLAHGAAFLSAQWDWVLTMRERVLSRPPTPPPHEITAEELQRLGQTLNELTAFWASRLNEPNVTWKLRRMKTRWGVCDFIKRRITYAAMLANKPRELVEYVVVHELTHLKAHGHGTHFKSLMDERLPNWRTLRRQLNSTAIAAPP